MARGIFGRGVPFRSRVTPKHPRTGNDRQENYLSNHQDAGRQVGVGEGEKQRIAERSG